MRFKKLLYLYIIIANIFFSNNCFCQIKDPILPRHNVTLNEAHIGSAEIDTMLLNSYEVSPSNILRFYLDSRGVFEKSNADFTSKQIVETALNNDTKLMGGPMLGDVKANGISIWFRPSNELPIHIKVIALNSDKESVYTLKPSAAGKEERLIINDLSPSMKYKYVVTSHDIIIAAGVFQTTPRIDEKKQVRVTFGSCFHKIGLHNPNLINSILKREPHAMMLLGDIAVDDRENNFSMHRSDYLLRDVSPAWKKLAANVPLYTSWDDHDYLNNDLSGVPEIFTKEDIEELRTLWRQNWNNPPNDAEGIYFNTRIGQVELIMLDTRSCREIEKRGEYGSYLGTEQMEWLKSVLKKSTATFKVISSGTMWSDYISNGKDSWGTWDIQAREEIFQLIEKEYISGVLLVSGDRHGARGFTIPRESGFKFYEFEPASLGGVPGPPSMANDTTNQLFGYHGKGLIAFGEFTFNMGVSKPQVTFRLIDEFGIIMEEHVLSYKMLTPNTTGHLAVFQ
ncbi:MAG: alkaline phosphatase family protein [Candidatus Atribacteria bacterium]|nr:alkaline phosphatase family protein [Candidatus Atribacteria bacterium]